MLFKIPFLLVFFNLTSGTNVNSIPKDDAYKIWVDTGLTNEIPFNIFNLAVTGQEKLKNVLKKNILCIVDFSRKSSEKRFYVIDTEHRKLLYNCLVAHGKNSGLDYANSFSNKYGSLKSSLGFYVTAETYIGTHGYTLRLDGMEKGINDNARAREIVIHGAYYVSDKFIRDYGRLGRSWGCPALPEDLAREIINTISDGACLFIYAEDKDYLKNSVLLANR